MVSYLRSSDCTIIYEFPHVVSHRVRQVDDMLSVLTKDVELNVQERQVDGHRAFLGARPRFSRHGSGEHVWRKVTTPGLAIQRPGTGRTETKKFKKRNNIIISI